MPDIPKGAKVPEDRKAKDEANGQPFTVEWTYPSPTEPDATATTTFEIDREAGNDYEVMEWFAELDDNPQYMTFILRKLLGREEHSRLKDTVRDEKGRVDPDRMFEFFDEMSDALGN